MKKIGDGAPMAGKTSSAGGLQVGFAGSSGKTPKVSTGYTKRKGNQPMGKGKIPGGMETKTGQGAGGTPVMAKSANTGKALGVSSASGARAKSKTTAPGANPTGANNVRVAGPVQKIIQKKASITGQSQTIMKAPSKQPKASGVGVTPPTTNWHAKLGFGGRSKA